MTDTPNPQYLADTVPLTDSERHRLLSSARRRHTLDALATLTLPVALEDLAAAVAAREADQPAGAGEPAERVAVSLHHVHLPLLDDRGVLDYDRATTRVVAFPAAPDSG
jgi:hypothetical protein